MKFGMNQASMRLVYSYGGNSYFIRHADGNWLIDSPKLVTPLVQQLQALGGIAHSYVLTPGPTPQ
jgi:hypothetical protein